VRKEWFALGAALAPAAALAGALSGPVFGSGVRAVLEDFVEIPSSGANPDARINILREAPDGSGRLFVCDQRGPLHVIDGGSVSPYLDLSVLRPDLKTSPGLASGFVSIAFHPAFATNGIFYTVHTEFVNGTPPTHVPAEPAPIAHHSVLTEWTAASPAANSWSGTTRELIRIAAPHHNHNLGELVFDPNLGSSHADYGLLYVASGDFGSAFRNDPDQLQRLDTLFGAILRIDPLGGNGTPYSYGIPASNPYASDGDPNTFGEIWAHGFRNAHRITWSRHGFGGPFVAELGEHNLEEIDVLVGGDNYGWPEREGTYAIDIDGDKTVVTPLPVGDAGLGYHYPVVQYDHEEGDAIAGLVVDEADPASLLYGRLIFGDIVNGRIFWADAAAAMAKDGTHPPETAPVFELVLVHAGAETTLLDVVRAETGNPSLSRADLRFGSDLEGHLYVMTKQDGWIRRLLPETLSPVPALRGPSLLLLGALLVAIGGRELRRARS
jgi:hypothetical protein